MSTDVRYNITGTTDVPQNVDKSKAAMSQMERAVEGLNKKMEGFGKDLVLSYIAPMVLLNKAIDFVAGKIEEQRQRVADAISLAEKGESRFIDRPLVGLAREASRAEQTKKEKELAVEAPAAVTEKALRYSDEIFNRVLARLPESERKTILSSPLSREQLAAGLSRDPEVQKIAMAGGFGNNQSFDALGVQNAVFGMGTVSPLVVAMTAQLEESQRQTALLERIANNKPDFSDDYTKKDRFKMPGWMDVLKGGQSGY